MVTELRKSRTLENLKKVMSIHENFLSSRQKKSKHKRRIQTRRDCIVPQIIIFFFSFFCRDVDGETALYFACAKGHVSIARLLVENGAKLDARNKHGKSLMHMAAYLGHVDTVKFLVGCDGCEIDAVDRGLSVAFVSIFRGFLT